MYIRNAGPNDGLANEQATDRQRVLFLSEILIP